MIEWRTALSKRQQYRLLRRARGLCRDCGNEAGGRLNCPACLGKQRERSIQKRVKRRQEGRCVTCGVKTTDGRNCFHSGRSTQTACYRGEPA